jgi:hypothetical protein
MERCEWDPERDRPAQTLPPDVELGCRNEATVSVGGDGAWHLCDFCAAMPRFARYKSRRLLDGLAKLPSPVDAEEPTSQELNKENSK